MFDAHGVGSSSCVVDLGAGTGQFALPAARRFGRVIAVDISPAMISVLRDRATRADLTNLTCVQTGFLSYQHEDVPADGVYTRNALHQLPDFWKAMALQRIAEMMRAGGVLRVHDLIYDFQPSEAGERLRRWMDGAVSDPTLGYTREDFAEHVTPERPASPGTRQLWCPRGESDQTSAEWCA